MALVFIQTTMESRSKASGLKASVLNGWNDIELVLYKICFIKYITEDIYKLIQLS